MSARSQKGLTLIELLIVVAIIGIVAGIAVPGLLRARMSGNEASAIGSMRAVNTAQQSYAQQCSGFSPDLPTLQAAGNYLSPDMTAAASVAKSGYTMTLTAGAGAVPIVAPPAACGAATTKYYATAVPKTVGSTGTRAFATDERVTIWQDTAGTAPTQPFAVAGTISTIQ